MASGSLYSGEFLITHLTLAFFFVFRSPSFFFSPLAFFPFSYVPPPFILTHLFRGEWAFIYVIGQIAGVLGVSQTLLFHPRLGRLS